MLANLRNGKVGFTPGVPAMTSEGVLQATGRTSTNVVPHYHQDATIPFNNEELGFNWSTHVNPTQITPSAMPAWLQEGVGHCRSSRDSAHEMTQSFTDLGLPPDGLDGIFFPGPITGWPTELELVPEAW